jgi:hypothetical protein
MKEHCSNCGQALSEENIQLALEDAGEDPQELLTEVSRGDGRNWTATKLDRYRFFCPRYSDERGCPGYSEKDGKKMAYWSTS